MASRLIMGDHALAAPSVVWPRTSGSVEHDGVRSVDAPSAGEQQQAQVLMNQQARIQELERELEVRPRQAYQQGYTEGQSKGTEQANARLEPVMAKLAHSIRDLSAVRKRHLIEAEQDAVRLAVAVARRILRRELSVDPESLLGIVKAAVERVDARDIHRVRIHPDDVPVLQRHFATEDIPSRVEIVADSSLERGSVIIDTSRGSLDASVSSQLLEIERGLVDLVRRNQ